MRQLIFGLILVMFTMGFCAAEPCSAEMNLFSVEKMSYAVASWYGPEFHGKQTASGQIFDMHGFTCAHRSYPFGSWLKVTNLLNDKTTFCVVNDRGPFIEFRGLDLSYAAAKVLDMITLGQCAVKIEFLGMDNDYMKAVKFIFKKGR